MVVGGCTFYAWHVLYVLCACVNACSLCVRVVRASLLPCDPPPQRLLSPLEQNIPHVRTPAPVVGTEFRTRCQCLGKKMSV